MHYSEIARTIFSTSTLTTPLVVPAASSLCSPPSPALSLSMFSGGLVGSGPSVVDEDMSAVGMLVCGLPQSEQRKGEVGWGHGRSEACGTLKEGVYACGRGLPMMVPKKARRGAACGS